MFCRTLLGFAILFTLLTVRPGLAQSKIPISTSPVVYHWHTLVLHHTKAAEILVALRWNGEDLGSDPPPDPFPFSIFPTLVVSHSSDALTPTFLKQSSKRTSEMLPYGVLRVYALQNNNSLLVESTDQSFDLVTKLVKLFDDLPQPMHN